MIGKLDDLLQKVFNTLLDRSGIKKVIGDSYRDYLRERFPNNDLEGAILNSFFDIDAHIMNANISDGSILGDIPLGKQNVSSYKELDLAKYFATCDVVIGKINAYISYNWLDEDRFISKAMENLNEINGYLKRNFMRFRENEDWNSFRKRYAKLFEKIELEIEKGTIEPDTVDFLKFTHEVISEHRQFISQIKTETSLSNQSLNYARSLTQELQKNLNLIERLKSGQDVYLDDSQVEENLMKLLDGQITRGRLQKTVSNKPKANIEEVTPSGEQVGNSVPINKEYVPKIYDKKTLEFLLKYEIPLANAKEIMDFHDIEVTRDFINALENTFKNYGIQKELKVLTRNNPEILTLKNGYKLSYIESLEHLYDLINPAKASGILPSFNTDIYSSSEKINSFIKSITEKKNNVKILPSEKFSREKDYNNFTALLESNPYAGGRMQKWVSKGFKKVKTEMYKKYSAEFGEGLFFKMDFGGRRCVYKLNNDGQGNYMIQVCTYFDLHPHYTKFYKDKK